MLSHKSMYLYWAVILSFLIIHAIMKPITRAIILTRIVTVQSRVWASPSRMIVVEVVNVVVCVFVAVIVSVTVVFL